MTHLKGIEKHVLDKGFVRVVDYMGTDEDIVNAARVSYGKGTRTVRENRDLIRYLMKHRHTTPFEMCVLKLHIKMPYFVARQMVRHRMASINEYSARYSEVSEDYYIPDLQVISSQSIDNKQGRGGVLPLEDAKKAQTSIIEGSEASYRRYKELLNGGGLEGGEGVARELARITLSLNFYTEWYWKIDLHNLMHFLRLRTHQTAQYEMRQYAEAIENIMAIWVPIAHEAYIDYNKGSKTLSTKDIAFLSNFLDKEKLMNAKSSGGLGKRELQNLKEIFA